jgi:hypothetical protein
MRHYKYKDKRSASDNINIQGVPKKPKTIEITIVKIWMPFQTAERNDA